MYTELMRKSQIKNGIGKHRKDGERKITGTSTRRERTKTWMTADEEMVGYLKTEEENVQSI